jgi:hypothetical protein
MVMGPGGITEKLVNPVKKVNGYYYCMYKPSKPGLYIITITYSGNQIQKSPFKVDVAIAKTSKIRAHGPGLETGIVGQPANFVVEQNGEPGTLGQYLSVSFEVLNMYYLLLSKGKQFAGHIQTLCYSSIMCSVIIQPTHGIA